MVSTTAPPLDDLADGPVAGPVGGRHPVWDWQGEGWRRVEHALAVGGSFLIAVRIQLTPQLVTAGDLFALALIPLWLPVLRRYAGARGLFILAALSVPAGLLLTFLNSSTHQISVGRAVTAAVLMVSLFVSVGFLLWARQRISESGLVIIFGFGLLIGTQTDNALVATNPWKYGFALPVTLIVLGLIQQTTRRRGFELAALAILCLVCALTDARSMFAVLLLTTAMLAWMIRPTLRTTPGSVTRAVLGLLLVGTIIYNVVQAAILAGFLGEETQERSERQINQSGSLILGGRPEIAATLALMRYQPWGFGSGTQPNLLDINAAKAGMATINYDPNNGYVENWMFGGNYALHSMFGDLWAQYSIVGLALAAGILVLVLGTLGRGISHKTASGAVLFLSVLTLWNIFFAPFYSSLKVLICLLAISLVQKALRVPAPPTLPQASRLPSEATQIDRTRTIRPGRDRFGDLGMLEPQPVAEQLDLPPRRVGEQSTQ